MDQEAGKPGEMWVMSSLWFMIRSNDLGHS